MFSIYATRQLQWKTKTSDRSEQLRRHFTDRWSKATWWSVLFRTDQQGGPNPGPQNYCCSFSSCSCPTCCHWPGSGVFHHWEASRTKLFGKEAGHGPRGQNPPHAWYTGSLWLALPPVQQRSPELCKYGADHVYKAEDRWLNGRIRLWSFSLLCYFKMKASVKA